jgi:hypothetical protein
MSFARSPAGSALQDRKRRGAVAASSPSSKHTTKRNQIVSRRIASSDAIAPTRVPGKIAASARNYAILGE